MSFIKYLDRIQRMDRLIRMKATGTTNEFAEKIGICRSVLLEHVREMKSLGAPIVYCRYQETYYYTEEKCSLSIEFIGGKINRINGGKSAFSFDSFKYLKNNLMETPSPNISDYGYLTLL